jgi:hypothetical protein
MHLMTSQCFDVTNVTKKWWDVGEHHCVSKCSFILGENYRESFSEVVMKVMCQRIEPLSYSLLN